MKITPELIEKYHLGLCSDQEKEAVEAWLKHGDYEPYAFKNLTPFPSEITEETMWKGMTSKLSAQAIHSATVNLQERQWKKQLFLSAKIAAVMLLSLSLCLWIYLRQNTPSPIHYKAYYAPKGKKILISLADGTRVHLNSGSELKVPEVFSDTIRTVMLQGEAYFEIQPNADKPFYIESVKSRVQVLGTKFNLQDFEDMETAGLYVKEGKVRFSSLLHPKEGVLLTAGQSAQFNAESEVSLNRIFENSLDWTEQILSFNNNSLREMMPILERWYGITITIKNPALFDRRYTGSYRNPSLNVLMDDLAFVLKFKYQINNQTLLIQ